MKMKKRNKLHMLAFMLVAALMVTVATPTVSARADDDLQETPSTNCDLLDNGIGGGYATRGIHKHPEVKASSQVKVSEVTNYWNTIIH